ncbi:MAG TPA: Na/Pi cotransporter family protein [Myxococcales bacterium]|nr:Na/Pi cotransporter family protein [Myxococcales bacterium]
MDLIGLLGGLALFLLGLEETRASLQLLAGDKLRSILFSLTGNRLLGVLAGGITSILLQSSTAATVMLVGFADSGLVSLSQANAVLLGADVGTTVVVQIIALRLSTYALILVAAGFFLRFAAKKRRTRYGGQMILGLGLLFFGMKLMGDAADPLSASPHFAEVIRYLDGNPAVAALSSAVVTVLLQGSAPVIGLLISASQSGALSLHAALPMVVGANVGTTFTPVMLALSAEPAGKRVAVSHFLFKIIGAAAVFPLLGPFERLVTLTAPGVARQIANSHTLFNVALSILFLPSVEIGARLLEKWYRPPEREPKFRPKYLDPSALEAPALACADAQREFLRMADIVADMFKDSLTVLAEKDLDLLADVEARDDKVDILNREIRFYLARLALEKMTAEQVQRQMTLITLTADIENVGDIVNKNILSLAQKRVSHGLVFSDEGWKELEGFYEKVSENFDLALSAFATGNEEIAHKVLRHKVKLVEIENELKQRHIDRLHRGLRESLETSGMHLDLLGYLRRINGLVAHLADAVVQDHRRPEEQETA